MALPQTGAFAIGHGMTDRHPSGAPWRNFYGRFRGKTIRASQHDYLDNDLDALSPGPIEWDVNPDRTEIDLADYFGLREYWLEIGFGGGEHLVHMAQTYPEVGIVGCEPFVNGVAMLLGYFKERRKAVAAAATDEVPSMPASLLPQVVDPVAERRRAKAREQLDAKLAAMAAQDETWEDDES